MRIDQSVVLLEGRSEQARQHTVTRTLREWTDSGSDVPSGPGAGPPTAAAVPAPTGSVQLDLSPEGKSRALECRTCGTPKEGKEVDDARIDMFERILYILTGKKVKLSVPALTFEQGNQIQLEELQRGEGPRRLGWGAEYQVVEQDYQREAVAFSAVGAVQTGDGRVLEFNVEFAASRELFSESSLTLKMGDAALPPPEMKDPLVVNLSASTASLGSRNFKFDLDVDGRAETLSFLNPGSGFLALDRNGNGQVDDGSELFGPQTGNGFQELAGYDTDGDGWLDEGDEIYDRLRVWTQDGNGETQLLALGKAGVGALYLGHVTTPFRLASPEGQTAGQVARSGVYLRENGTAGTMQHLDLAV